MITEKLTGRPDANEPEMIRDYIMYPHLTTMVQKSLDDMGFAHVTLKNVIIRCLEHIMFTIGDDYRRIKQEMRRRGIKEVLEDTNDGILYFSTGAVKRVLASCGRTEIILKLTNYTNDLAQQLKNRP
jgi:hypothetical protein